MLRGAFTRARWGGAFFHDRDKIHRTDGTFPGSLFAHRRMHCARPVIDLVRFPRGAVLRARRSARKKRSEYDQQRSLLQKQLHRDFLPFDDAGAGEYISAPITASNSATATW